MASRGRHHHVESHKSDRIGWLRAAVLGANDGLLSVAALVAGVAAADNTRSAVAIAGLASLTAGAFSMAVGEYSSVSSQRDTELADLAREKLELIEQPDLERHELQRIYENRGLPRALAAEVSEHMSDHDALAAHARDELGIDPDALANPKQAAVVSAASFLTGGVAPLVVALVLPAGARIAVTVALTLLLLGALGSLGARLGGAPRGRAVVRLVIGGGLALALAIAIGAITGAAIS